jgi:hypothetical protein
MDATLVKVHPALLIDQSLQELELGLADIDRNSESCHLSLLCISPLERGSPRGLKNV